MYTQQGSFIWLQFSLKSWHYDHTTFVQLLEKKSEQYTQYMKFSDCIILEHEYKTHILKVLQL